MNQKVPLKGLRPVFPFTAIIGQDEMKLSLIFFDFFTKSFVIPLMADETTITLYLFLTWPIIILATFLILSIVPTEVPPNFNTTIFIDKIFYKNLNILIKYILIVMSTNNEK